MKKLAVFISWLCIMTVLSSNAQVSLHTIENFENGLPTDWTTSSSNVSVETNQDIAINGEKFARIKHASGVEYLQSSLITVEAGKSVRLEFNHIPMTDCNVRVQLVIEGNPTPVSLSGSNVYDNKYRPGINGNTGQSFNAGTYYPGKDITKLTSINSSMWQHEVYYLTSKLGQNVSFRIRFQMPTGNDNGYGWLIDDFKIYTAPTSDGILPRLEQLVSCPNIKNYPYCNDADIEFKISDADGGLSSIEDSLYVEYYTPGNTSIAHVKLQRNTTGNYVANIPYAGIDSTVYWRAVITDANGNQTLYPFTGNYFEYKYVRPYTGGDVQVKQSATGTESLIFATDYAKVSNQIRYSAKELQEAGYSAGIINGFYLNIKNRPANVPTLQNFKVYIGSISSDYKFEDDDNSQYSDVVNVINQVEYVVPELGWQYLAFDNGATFIWDGESDIILKACYDGNKVGGATKLQSYSTGSDKQYQTRRLLQDATTSIVACSGNFNTDSKFLIASKPNIRFNFVNRCYFTADAGIRKDTLLSPIPAKDCNGNLSKTFVCQNGSATTLRVMLRNDGTDTLYRVKVKWMIDDNEQSLDSSFWTGVLKPLHPITKVPQDTAIVYTATTNFRPPAGVHELKIWTEMPDESLVDWNYDNDTATFKLFVTDGQMNGTYAVGGNISGISAGRTFKTFSDVFIMLINSQVGGECIFRINTDNTDTIYTGTIDFPACIAGLSSSNNITFINQDLNHTVVFEPDTLSNECIFNLSDAKYVKFKNIGFSLDPQLTSLSTSQFDMVKMNGNTNNITFDSCSFISYGHTTKYYDRVYSLVNISNASNISIENCLFDAPAKYAIKIEGSSSQMPSSNINISKSTFNIISDSKQNIVENALYATFANSLDIIGNSFSTTQELSYYENLTSVFYAVLLNNIENTVLTKNNFELYSLSAISASIVNNSVFANNMLSLDNKNSNAVNYNQYGLYMQSGNNNSIIYNNVYSQSLKMSSKKAYGFAIGTANTSSTGNIIKNNILVSDGYGNALTLRSNSDNDFEFSNNLYYKKTSISNIPLFTFNGETVTDTSVWKESSKEIESYYTEDPSFLSWNNLYSTNITLCEHGDWITAVTDDYFGEKRPDATEKRPCIGAREFNPPPNNIYVLKTGLTDYEEISLDTYSGCDLTKETVFIEFKNISSNTIAANTLQLNYSVDGNLSVPVIYPYEVKPNEVNHFDFSNKYDFSALDSNRNFVITAFSILNIDTVKNNDTTSAKVISYYRLPALADQNVEVKYGESTTIDVTSLCPNDSVYWFYTQTDSVEFFRGHSFQTNLLYTDSTIYFARKEEIPSIKITEIQYSKDASKEGITPNLPNYVSVNNAYEISNCGSQDIDMTDYKFNYYSGANITKAYVSYTFPKDFILKAHSSVVLVADNNVTVDDTIAIGVDATKFKVSTTAKGGFSILNASGKFIDALTVNGADFAASMNVPASVWQKTDNPITMTNTSAGIIRQNIKDNTSAGWILADEFNTMTIGTYNNNLTDSTENLCLGYLTPYHINITDVPNYDPGISKIEINNVSSDDYNEEEPYSSCGLGMSPIKVTITNTGLQDINSIPVIGIVYEDGSQIDSFYAEYTQLLRQFETADYTFDNLIDLTATNKDRNIVIKLYTSREDDVVHNNDTVYMYIKSLKTPLTPTTEDVTINYASQAVLTVNDDNTIIWYADMATQEELTRGDTYQTPILYENTTYYVESFIQNHVSNPIGKDSALVTTSSPSPSPFNARTKNVKEQYLLKADSLLAYGYAEGNIKGFAVNINSITPPSKETSIVYSDFNVRLGITQQEYLSSWEKNLNLTYSGTFSMQSTEKGWKFITFDEPYYWDGVSDLVMEICFSVEKTGTVVTYTKATQQVSSLSYKSTTTQVCDYTSTFTSYSKIPYFKLDMDVFGCKSERTAVNVLVENVPTCDAGVVEITSPTDNVISGDETPISVKIKNYGTDNLSSVVINWKINSMQQQSVTWNADQPLLPNETIDIPLGTYIFNAGISFIEVDVSVECDNFTGNDTISKQVAACLGNDTGVTQLTIGGNNPDYNSITSAIEELKQSGICGPIEFIIASGTYNEKLSLSDIRGVSEDNTITFKGAGTNNVIVTYNDETINTEDNVLLDLDSASFIKFADMTLLADSTFDYVINMNNVSSVYFDNVVISTTNEKNPITTLVNIQGENKNLYFIADTFSNGAYSLKTEKRKDLGVYNMNIDSCTFIDFKASAIDINNAENLNFRYNKVLSHSNDFIADALKFSVISGKSKIESNEVVLLEGNNKARNGIIIRNASFEDMNPLSVANNSVSIIGASKVKAHGIDIDSSNFVNVYYNTILTRVSTNNTTARDLFIGKSNTNIIVRNNNLDNQCGGYAYYVESPGTQVLVSDNNNYKANGTKLTYWTKDCATVTALQVANKLDANSLSAENKFRSDSCLDFLYPTDIVRKAESLEDISVDIYGRVRSVSPNPTIGAYEYQFNAVDAGIVSVISPDSKLSYIEGDDIDIEVVAKNFGSNGITRLDIYGEMKRHKDSDNILQSIHETYNGLISSLDTLKYTFNQKFQAQLNDPYTDSLYVQIYTVLSGDTVNYNDTMSLFIKVLPGKDVSCVAIKKQDANIKCGRDMRKQVIEASIKNMGNKSVGPGDVINVTYEVRGANGNLKASNTENITFPYTYVNSSGSTVTLNDLQPNGIIQYFAFNKTVNLEPTGTNDTNWTISAYVSLSSDNNKTNDTATKVTFTALASPIKPVAHDTSIYYATYASVRATQADELAIKWYHDTLDANPFYKPTKYEESTRLNIDGMLYSDTMFYVMVNGKGNNTCPSDFVPVKVKIRNRCSSDVAALEIVAPPAQPEKGYIFMSEDTVKVKLTNYGTQTQTGFNVVCSVRPMTSAGATEEIIRETCDVSVMTDATAIYTFKHLFDFTKDTTTYELRAWTENNKDCTHIHDTTDIVKIVPLFNMEDDATIVSNPVSLDITRVQLGTIDNISPALSERYTDYTNSVAPAELFKGLKDSLLITIEPSSEMKIDEDTELSGWIKAWIDWNRDGVFDNDEELVYSEEAKIGDINRAMISVPSDALSGYTIMRIIVSQDDETHDFGPNPGNSQYGIISAGEIEDYKLHISPVKDVNAELVRFVSPDREDTVAHSKVVVRLRNAGKTELTSADITWIYGSDTTVYNWTGALQSSEIEDVELAEMDLSLGHNNFKAYVDVTGDEYSLNDTVVLNNYIYPIYTIPYTTDFDNQDTLNYDFFAYESDPRRPSNIWQIGTPDVNANDVIKSAYSRPNCWKTNISGHYGMNNTSILYSPIFNIDEGNPKPDTVSFMMRRDMGPGANMVVEYLNYKGLWTVLGTVNDPHGTNWYDSEDGFTKANVTWERSSYSLESINGELGKKLQFRFVFTSQDGRVSDGVAIDDFSIDRALRDLDAGVVKIELTPEELPSYGQYFYPKVTVHNFGKKDITSFKVCYLAEDMHIPQCEDVLATIPVAGDLEYTFHNGRYLDISMPDPFSIMSYTRLNPDDLYTDNDTAFAHFVISPLLVDVGLLEIMEPLTKVASNDNVEVTIKVKNYGLEPIEDLPVYYTTGGNNVVAENIHFVPALNNGDEYVYTFNTPYHTSFGTVNLKTWVGLSTDTYPDNDTLYKRLQSGNTVLDLEAKYITLDESNSSDLGLQLAFMNHSSVVLKNITVGYYINGDKSTAVEETYLGGDELTASTMGYHTFARRINRALYQSVCAYVKYVGDEDPSNDTTCSVYLGYRDLKADSIFVEQTANPECKVQLIAHHVGTLAGNKVIRACYVLNGNYSSVVRQDFQLTYDNPDGRPLQLTFDRKVPRNDQSEYNIVAWVEYAGDNNKSNDTTRIVRVQSYVDLEQDTGNGNTVEFVVKQNKPNPFADETVVEIQLPEQGEVYLDIQDNNGRKVYTYRDNFSQGTHYMTFNLNTLPAGTYYYTVHYRNNKITKKMIKR